MPKHRLMDVVANRGFSAYYPENTIAAFQAAANLGVSGLYGDLSFTSDEEPVIIRDAAIERVTLGPGKVRDYSWAQLQLMDGGRGYDAYHRQAPVPHLASLLHFVRSQRRSIHLMLEVQPPRAMQAVFSQSLESLIRQYRLDECATLVSTDFTLLAALKQYCPGLRIHAICTSFEPAVFADAEKIGASAVHIDFPFVSDTMVKRLHDQNLEVYSAEVHEAKAMGHAVRWGVDGVITGQPDLLLAFIYRGKTD